MADIISDYWVSFAENGDPNVVGAPDWLAYKDDACDYISFSDGVALSAKNLHPGAFQFHEKIVQLRKARGDSSLWFNNIGLLSPILYD